MSGGHYNFSYYQLEQLAEDISEDFKNDGKFMTENWSAPYDENGKKPMVEANLIEDATPEQKLIILNEVKSLIEDLKKCAKRAKALDWYMSGDTSADSYLENLKEEKLIKNE